MNQKGFTNIFLIILAIVIIGGIVGYFVFFQKQESAPTTTTPSPVPAPTSSATLSLLGDQKSIVADGKTLLVIDDDAILNFFKTESQLCEGYNLTSTPDRRMFCENRATFKNETRFTSIVPSPDNMKVGFTIESDTLTPDKIVGIFYPYRPTNKIHFLTNYYLGNEFIGFSPNGTYFVYQGDCWEGMCGLFIKDSETLAEKISLNNPKYVDFRSVGSEFVRWVSDNEVEYKLGTELKRISF